MNVLPTFFIAIIYAGLRIDYHQNENNP